MMKVLHFLLMCIFVQGAWAQVPSTTVQFAERVFNFGTIQEKKGKVSHTFVFENKGKVPVTIDEVSSFCGCIGKVMSDAPVKPGGKGKVVITFDPGYKSGFFSKEIVILTRNRQEYNRIWVEGVIEPAEHSVKDDYPYDFGSGLYMRLKVLAFGYLKPGDTKVVELHYANDTDREMTLNFLPLTKENGLIFVNPGKIAARGKGVVRFTYKMPGTVSQNVTLRVSPQVNGKSTKESLELLILYDKKGNYELKPRPYQRQ